MSDIKITVCTGAVLNLHVGADAPRVTIDDEDSQAEVNEALVNSIAALGTDPEPEQTYLTLDLIFAGNDVIARSADGAAAAKAWEVLEAPISRLVDANIVTLDRLAGLAEVYSVEIRALGFGTVLVSSSAGSRHVDLRE